MSKQMLTTPHTPFILPERPETPKGVLHEYGNIEECIRSVNYEGNPIISEKDRGALLAPMNFVATIMMLFCVLYCGGCKLFIASYATIKNPLLLKKCSLKNA